MGLKVKVTNAWKDMSKAYVKVTNAWKEAQKVYVKVNGAWKLAYTKELPVLPTFVYNNSADWHGAEVYINNPSNSNEIVTYYKALGRAMQNGDEFTITFAHPPTEGKSSPHIAWLPLPVVYYSNGTIGWSSIKITNGSLYDADITYKVKYQNGVLNYVGIDSYG